MGSFITQHWLTSKGFFPPLKYLKQFFFGLGDLDFYIYKEPKWENCSSVFTQYSEYKISDFSTNPDSIFVTHLQLN